MILLLYWVHITSGCDRHSFRAHCIALYYDIVMIHQCHIQYEKVLNHIFVKSHFLTEMVFRFCVGVSFKITFSLMRSLPIDDLYKSKRF